MIDIDTQTRPAPIEVVSPIRPSEAIRLGCLIAPVQAFGAFGKDNGAVCAAGALVIGLGGDDPEMFDHAEMGIPLDVSVPSLCPATGKAFRSCSPRTWGTSIFHLNDDHRWSRERIADWLESIGL